MAADADHDRVINTDRDRLIVRGREGDELRLRPWLEGANAEGFNAEFFKTLFDSDADLLAEEALRGGPLSHERIAAQVLPRVVDQDLRRRSPSR
jgi:hypothetical protein